MKCKAALLALLCTSCTPAEKEIAREIAHEAVVAEQAIEHDLECPGEAFQCQYNAAQGATAETQIKNQRQYPPRNTRKGH